MTNPVQIKRVLISVSDKSGIAEFAQKLKHWNIEIISTGGTLKYLHDAGFDARSVTDVTGFPEILDGRVKTLHPNIHAGLLAISSNPSHQQQMQELGIQPIDMVVVNLYPFERTVSRTNISLNEAIEQIDIGGPTMLRSAAKNFKCKTVIVNPARYDLVVGELEKTNGSISEETRFALAKEVFQHTARYDAVISNYLAGLNENLADQSLPDVFSMSLPKLQELRYGENPHQRAALYGGFNRFFEQIHGKELSFNNIVDIQAAVELMVEFGDEPTAVIVKHTNPCGVGCGSSLSDAYAKALATDPKSAYGGIVCLNKPLDIEIAASIDKIFTEVIIAPEFPKDVLAFLQKKRDRRLVKQLKPLQDEKRFLVKSVASGMLVQTCDDVAVNEQQLKFVTRRKPTAQELAAMMFAWRVAKHVKSNAIVYARHDRTIGVGAGQMSRVDSSRIAALKAQDAGLDLLGTAVGSDAFFPFADGLLAAVNVGATAVIQPGGSIRDEEVIKAANEHDVAMAFTGLRHFKH